MPFAAPSARWLHIIALSVGAVLLAGITVTPAHAEESTGTAHRLAQQALAGRQAVDIVADLTTRVGQRLAGTEAERRAADWAVEKMMALGLENVRVEPFAYSAWERLGESARIVSPVPHNLVITALGNAVATPAGGLTAPLVLVPTFAELMAAPAGAYDGKIVLVTQRTPPAHDGGGYGGTAVMRFIGAAEASKRGAVGYLIRSLGTHSHRFAHTGSQRGQEGVKPIPAAAMSPPDVEMLERLAEGDAPILLRMDLKTRFLGDTGSQNVIGEIIGSEYPDEIVLISAHLDSWDLGTGALDDGAGVGIVLATAQLIRSLPQPPKRTIRIVLFGAEEPGIVGAIAYADKHNESLASHIVATEADFGQGPVYAFATRAKDPNHPTLVAIRNALARYGVIKGDNAARGGPDIAPLIAAGVPAVTLALDGSDYFDFHHTADDTFDKIEPARIAQSVASYTVFTYLMAQLGGDFRPVPE